MIHEINYKYDHKRLYNEAIYADGYVSFNDPLTKKDIPEWCISKTIGPYGLSIVKDFSKKVVVASAVLNLILKVGCVITSKLTVANKLSFATKKEALSVFPAPATKE